MEKINWLLVIEGKGSLVAGVEEVKEDKYRRGIVRICSTRWEFAKTKHVLEVNNLDKVCSYI